MSYLLDEELNNLRAVRMIIHVVGQRDAEFALQPEIEVQQEGFFRARIVSEASDGVHSFTDGSPVRAMRPTLWPAPLRRQRRSYSTAQNF